MLKIETFLEFLRKQIDRRREMEMKGKKIREKRIVPKEQSLLLGSFNKRLFKGEEIGYLNMEKRTGGFVFIARTKEL